MALNISFLLQHLLNLTFSFLYQWIQMKSLTNLIQLVSMPAYLGILNIGSTELSQFTNQQNKIKSASNYTWCLSASLIIVIFIWDFIIIIEFRRMSYKRSFLHSPYADKKKNESSLNKYYRDLQQFQSNLVNKTKDKALYLDKQKKTTKSATHSKLNLVTFKHGLETDKDQFVEEDEEDLIKYSQVLNNSITTINMERPIILEIEGQPRFDEKSKTIKAQSRKNQMIKKRETVVYQRNRQQIKSKSVEQLLEQMNKRNQVYWEVKRFVNIQGKKGKEQLERIFRQSQVYEKMIKKMREKLI